MSHPLEATLPPHPALEYATGGTFGGPGLEPVASPDLSSSLEPHPLAAGPVAHRAVEAALRTADAFSAREQKSVDLHFSVGHADLRVRVELEGGEVRTTFRTDSPELRAALAHEWQVVTSGAPGSERSVRLAPPSFVAADGSAGNATGGDASARDGRSPARSGGPAGATLSGTTRTRGAASAAAPAPALRLATAMATSRHLQTLA